MSRRKPRKRTLLIVPSRRAVASSSSRSWPWPTIQNCACGNSRQTCGIAANRSRCPFFSERWAIVPMTGVSAVAPNSSRTSRGSRRGDEFRRAQRVVEHRDLLGGDALRDEVVLHRLRHGEQVRLLPMPAGGREALHVADRAACR